MKKIFFMLCIAILITLLAAGCLYAKLPKAEPKLPDHATADLVVVDKSDRTLKIFKNDILLKTYSISLGRGGLEPKRHEGDKRTPEGNYLIDRRNNQSSYYRSLHIDYPDKDDIERAKSNNVSAGSDIMIHGLRNGTGFLGRFHLLFDWTQGCIAVTNAEMDELWHAIPDGTAIEIKP